MSTCFWVTLCLCEGGAELTDLQLCHYITNHTERERVYVCVCLGDIGSIEVLTESDTTICPFPTTLYKSSFQKNRPHYVVFLSLEWCVLDVHFACSWLAETVVLSKPNQSLLRKQVSPPSAPSHPCGGCFDGYFAGGVVLLPFPSPIQHAVSLPDFNPLR